MRIDPEEYVELVLRCVEAVPRGRVTTYGAVAEVVGAAVGGGGPRLVGGNVADALATTSRMHEITLGENPRWSVPVLEFQGTPTGIDVTRVCRTGILPQINTGMAGKVAGVGQVGAGLVTPPAEIFPKALSRLAELTRERAQNS